MLIFFICTKIQCIYQILVFILKELRLLLRRKYCAIIIHIGIMDIERNVGVIISYWLDQGKVIAIGRGTALAVSSQITITCSHNLFNQKLKYCSYVQFIPNVEHDNYSSKLDIYRSQIDKCKYSYLSKSFINCPTKEQLAFIFLQRPLSIQKFAKFGNILPHETGKEIVFISYPDSNSKNILDSTEDLIIKREITAGKLYQPEIARADKKIVMYTNKTSFGCSGGCGFVKNDEGIFKIVFLHTHGGADKDEYNLGLYFDEEVVFLMDKFLRKLQQQNGLSRGQYMEKQLVELLFSYINFYELYEEIQRDYDESKLIHIGNSADQSNSSIFSDQIYQSESFQSDFADQQVPNREIAQRSFQFNRNIQAFDYELDEVGNQLASQQHSEQSKNQFWHQIEVITLKEKTDHIQNLQGQPSVNSVDKRKKI